MNKPSASIQREPAAHPAYRQLGDFPFVFLSYDEPWADAHWFDLKSKVPHAVRVHGVKGLDACHKAAAEAVEGDWLVTVDADTLVSPNVMNIKVPQYLLRDPYRLDWLSRNMVNGLWSGNGCLKLWSRWLLQNMRTHEAAEGEQCTIDHDIGAVAPGQSGQLTRPERLSSTWPAKTAYHAFRAGFREAVFLHQMALQDQARRDLPRWQSAGAARPLRIWCSVGRHAENGLWVLYGARLGLMMPIYDPSWRIDVVNDYAWLDALWHKSVVPQFLRSKRFGQTWNWDRLETETRRLGQDIRRALEFDIAEFDRPRSQYLAQNTNFSPNAAAPRNDALGYRMMLDASSAEEAKNAQAHLEIAQTLDHAAAFDNIGTLHARKLMADAETSEAAWNFRAADALGSKHSANHLKELERDVGHSLPEDSARPARVAANYTHVFFYDAESDVPDPQRPGVWVNMSSSEERIDVYEKLGDQFCLAFDPGLLPSARTEKHVIDPKFCAQDSVIDYAWQCKMTGRIGTGGVRFGRGDQVLTNSSNLQVVLNPTVLGIRNAPQTPQAARRLAQADARFIECTGQDLPLLGRDENWGDIYVLTLLHTLLGRDVPADVEELAVDDRGALIAQLSREIAGSSDVQALTWSGAESRGVKRMLTDVAPPDVWKAAELSCPTSQSSDIIQRTSHAIWGRFDN